MDQITRIAVDEKYCPHCKQTLPAARFGANRGARTGLMGYCRECNAEKSRAWKAKNPERAAAHAAQRPPRSTLERRKVGLWVNFRMTWDAYKERLAEQDGRCAICETEEPGSKSGTFVVDHDHTCCPSQKTCGLCVRGLLCAPCNLALGQMRDDPKRLMAAVRYLSR